MTEIKTASSCIISLALLGAVTSCVPVRPQPVRNTFLPPAPAAAAPRAMDSDPPPHLEARVELRSAAHPLVQAQGTRANRLEALLREAQWHFQEGRRYYQEGDAERARREFDRAVDVLLAIPDRPAALNTELENLVDQTASSAADDSGAEAVVRSENALGAGHRRGSDREEPPAIP